jgi:cellulose synthase operon protein C
MKPYLWSSISSVYFGLLALTAPLLLPLVELPVQAQVASPADVRQGYALLAKGWVNQAIKVLQQAVQRYPQSVQARLGLAIAYRRAGRDAEAFQTYEQVVKLDPGNPLALKSIGLLGGFRPEWQQRGIAALTVVLTQTPNDLEALTQRALLYGYQGRFDDSLADYQIVLRTNPTPAVLMGAAQVAVYNGNYAQGLELFERYLSTGKPLTGSARLAYARGLSSSGRATQAIQVLESQPPTMLDAVGMQWHYELSRAYLANQEPTRAIATLSPLRGRPEAKLTLARGLYEMGRQTNTAVLVQEANTLFKQALTEATNPPLALFQEVADILSTQSPRERDYALQSYRRLVQLEPNNPALQIKRLALENQLGYLSRFEVRQSLRSLLQPLPSDLGQQRRIAEGLMRISPDAEFLSVYQTLVQNPAINQPFLHFRLAQILVERNELPAARNALAVYVNSPQSKGDLAPQLLAAEIERRAGNLEAAARRYQAVIEFNPVDADVGMGALRGLAGIRLAQGLPHQALQVYDQLVARNPQDLTLPLGRASLAYQAQQITAQEAQAVLTTWLSNRPTRDAPPELLSLVGALPADAQRENLYESLTASNPDYMPVQVRFVQMLMQRNPTEARARVNQMIASWRQSGLLTGISADLAAAQLAQVVDNTELATNAYQAVLTKQPGNVDALVGLGDLQFKQRRFETAEKFYNQALIYQPKNINVQRSRIEVDVARDYPMEAIQKLEQLKLQLQLDNSIDSDIARRQQKLEEDLLQRRGFQPPWERY